nr:hypothetical protein [Tanacetum cinerariifolium]
MSAPVFVDPDSSTHADGAQSSRVPVPLPKDPYEAIRQAYLVGTDTESEPFEGEARTPESPHIVAPPTCHVEESEGSGTSGARSTSSNSTALLLPDHLLTHTTPVLVPILHRTARMAVRVPPVMSPGLSASMVEVAAMSDLAFCKRFRSSYDSSPSPTLPVTKRYRGMSELILGTDSEEDEEVEESSDSDSKSEDIEDEGPTTEDEYPTAEDEGLAARVEGSGVDDKSYGLDDESHGVDDESRGLDDESYGIDGEGRAVSAPLGLRYRALRRQELALEEDDVYKDSIVYIDIPTYPPPAPPVQTPPSPEWSSGSFPISPAPSIVPSSILSPMIPLTVPLPIATPATAETEGFFTELGAQVEIHGGLIRDHTIRLRDLSSALFEMYDRDIGELFTRSGAVRDEAALQRELQEMRDRVTALEQERDRKE